MHTIFLSIFFRILLPLKDLTDLILRHCLKNASTSNQIKKKLGLMFLRFPTIPRNDFKKNGSIARKGPSKRGMKLSIYKGSLRGFNSIDK